MHTSAESDSPVKYLDVSYLLKISRSYLYSINKRRDE